MIFSSSEVINSKELKKCGSLSHLRSLLLPLLQIRLRRNEVSRLPLTLTIHLIRRRIFSRYVLSTIFILTRPLPFPLLGTVRARKSLEEGNSADLEATLPPQSEGVPRRTSRCWTDERFAKESTLSRRLLGVHQALPQL